MIRAIQIENNNQFKKKVKESKCNGEKSIRDLLESLLSNELDIAGLATLRCHIKEQNFNAEHLSYIIQRIYDLNDLYIYEISAVEGVMKKLNEYKNKWRNKTYTRKIKKGFRQKGSNGKVILAEGDSWFNYPILLTDIIDRLIMEKDKAVYSIAASGDWLLNMLTKRQYIEELSVIHPDWFIISGGGNDLVGARRLAAIITDKPNNSEFEKNEWAKSLIKHANQKFIQLDKKKFDVGVQYLSKDFFALLMFFHLQYYFMLYKILRKEGQEKFGPIKIITQGYDYVIPGDSFKFGWNPFKWYRPFLRFCLRNGRWLKYPMQIRGIYDPEIQQAVLYSMIYLFNEMIIQTGHLLNQELKREEGDLRVFHIDSRSSIGPSGWTDELHPDVDSFKTISGVFINCIDGGSPAYDHVFVVNKKAK